jgi:capsular exopolysaccharide synthesis family protein
MNDSSEVKLHFLDYWRVIRVRSGIVLLTFLLVMVTASITTYFLPREYLSKVTMEVKPDNAGMLIFQGGNNDLRGTSDAQFGPTQFNIIQSKGILYPVINQLKLQDKWLVNGTKMPMEQLFLQLRGKLDMKPVRNTELIEIGVYSTDNQEAADIANTIAVCYQEKRRQDQDAAMTRSLANLKTQVEEQRAKVQEAQSKLLQLRAEKKIIDLNPETLDVAQGTAPQLIMVDQQKAQEAQTKVTELKTQIDQLKGLTPDQVITIIRQLGIEDQTLTKNLPLYQESAAEEVRLLNSGLGQKHPRILALRATKEVYGKQLNDAVTALLGSLETKYKIAKGTLDELNSKLSASQDDYNRDKLASKEYIDAKTAYIQAREVLKVAETKLSTEGMQKQMTMFVAKIWEQAEPSMVPAKPNVPAYLALSVLIGLICGVGLAFFIEYLDTSVKTLDDVEKFLGIPVLAVVPKNVGTIHTQAADLPDAEAYRILRTNLEFNRKDPNAKTLTMISGGPGEGKSTTLLNLAYTCAKGGYNVLVVDADIRRPSQHRLLDMDNATGLTNYLLGQKSFEEIIVPTKIENLSFVPSGLLPSDAVGILNSQRMADLIYNAKRKYDLVFLDSPPILGVSDGAVLASEVDMVVMVVEYRRFPRTMLQRVKQAIENVGGHLIGVVLNKVETKHDQGYQYYTNYYNYYSPRAEDRQKSVPRQVAPRDVDRRPQHAQKPDQY